jgi:hypothetical protein
MSIDSLRFVSITASQKMPQISRTTNPTGLKKLDAKLFSVRVQTSNAERSFWLEKFEHVASGLPVGLRLSCVAHCGTVDKPDLSAKPLHKLATNKPLKFRFLIHAQGDPKLAAFADGVRAADDAGMLGGSLVDIELADLKGSSWRLVIQPLIVDADKPVLLVEKSLFTSVQAAANNPWIAVLVMPEVLRQIATVISKDSACLDDSAIWASSWAPYLLGISGQEPPDADDDDAQKDWVESVVDGFCAKPALRAQMLRTANDLNGELL